MDTFHAMFKKQTSVEEKQYQGLNKLFKSDTKEEPVTIKKVTKTSITVNIVLMTTKMLDNIVIFLL